MTHRYPRGSFPTRIPVLLLVAVMVVLNLNFFSTAMAADVSVSAVLNTTSFTMDSAAILTVDVQGARGANINLQPMKGLRFHDRGQSTQIQVINGAFTASNSSRYLIQALEPGKYTIPPIEVEVDGEKYKTTPIDFEVTRTATPQVPSQSTPGNSTQRLGTGEGDNIAFIRINNIKEKSYTGEIIPIEIKAYFKQGLKVQLATFPVLLGDGFVMPQLNEEPQQTTEQINNTNYSVITWKTSLSAVKEGKHKLDIELEATLLFPQRSRRSSPFNNRGFFQDDFFDDFFGSYQKKTVTLASPEMLIEARPLPTEGKPEDFSGAIGIFTLDVKAEPTEIGVGEPISLVMTINGLGNFDRVTAPRFPENKDWKTYSPSSEFIAEGAEYHGKKQFEQAIVLKKDTVSAIPPLSFVYFDPTLEQYKELKSKAIALKVTGKSSASPPVVSPSSTSSAVVKNEDTSVPTKIEGLAPIQLESGRSYTDIRPIFLRPWYLVITILCFFTLLVVLSISMRRKHLTRNPAILKQKKLEKLLAASLQSLEQEEKSGTPQTFLAACRKAIQDQLGLVWDRESSAITLDYVNQKLPADSPLATIFATAEQSAYGGFTLTPKEMAEYRQNLQNELGKIQ